MRYLGTVKCEDGRVIPVEAAANAYHPGHYQAVEVGRSVLLFAGPIDRERLERIEQLAAMTISAHRVALKGLSK